MIELPIIGSLLEAGGMILEKKILKRKKMNFKNYTVYQFFAIVISMLPIIYFSWKLDKGALSFFNLFLFGFVVLSAVVANILVFYSLKRQDIGEFEPLWLMQPLFTILLAFLIYKSERNWEIVGLALIASLSLVFAHVKKRHLVFDKYIIAALIGSLLFSVELIASKPLLQYFSPFSFYFLRCAFVLAITFALFRPNTKALDKKSGFIIFVVGLMWIFYRAIIYYGYESYGIVFTTIIFILSPVLMLVFAAFFLKEKITMKQIVLTIIIVICIVSAIFVKGVS